MKVSKYEYTMQLLAAMASINIAREQKISRTKAFFRFMKSQTAAMLFDESTDMWMNGPDYIADEYRRERLAKKVGQEQKDENGFAADAAKPFVSDGRPSHFYLKKEIIKIENTKTELPKILK